jgi:hypothetical protein
MDAVSRYGALTLMNRGNWFLTCRGTSNGCALDGKDIQSRKIDIIEIFFIVRNKLSEEGC